jgi:hypothetical protein
MRGGWVHLRCPRPVRPAGRIPVTRCGTRLQAVRLATPGVMMSVAAARGASGRLVPLAMPTERRSATRPRRTHRGPGRCRAAFSAGSRAGFRGGMPHRWTWGRTRSSRPWAPVFATPRPQARTRIAPDAHQALRRDLVRPARASHRAGGLGRKVRDGSPVRRREAVRMRASSRTGVLGGSVRPAPARRMVPVGVPGPGPRMVPREVPIPPRRRARAVRGRARGQRTRPRVTSGARRRPMA